MLFSFTGIRGCECPCTATTTRTSEISTAFWSVQEQLEAKFEMKTVVVGHSGLDGVATEGKILIRATDERWQ